MEYILPVETILSRHQRKMQMAQEPHVIWLTGLSGSGKTTLGLQLENYFFHKGYKVFLLDGDSMRKGLNKDLGFSEKDRQENLRRVSEVAKLMLDAGLIVICAFISPFRSDRLAAKSILGEERFTEVYVSCPLNVCEERDTKELYAKARCGLIQNFTGISSPYEVPCEAQVEVRTDKETMDTCVHRIIQYVEPLLQLKL